MYVFVLFSRTTLATYVMDRAVSLARNPEAVEALKEYLTSLDMKARQNLLEEVQVRFSAERDLPPWPPSTITSSALCYSVFWNLLYAKKMQCARIPALATLPVQPGRGEESNGSAEGQKPNHCERQQHQSEVYANIFSALGSIVGEMLPATTQELHLDCYRKPPPATLREKGLIFNFIEGFRSVTTLNLGLGCDDSLLKEIARQVLYDLSDL